MSWWNTVPIALSKAIFPTKIQAWAGVPAARFDKIQLISRRIAFFGWSSILIAKSNIPCFMSSYRWFSLPVEILPMIFIAGTQIWLYESCECSNSSGIIQAFITRSILDFEFSDMQQIAQITSDCTSLLEAVFNALDFRTLQRIGHAYLMYFSSGKGLPLHKLVTAHAPFLMSEGLFVFSITSINAFIPPALSIKSRYLGLSAAMLPMPHTACSTIPGWFSTNKLTNSSIPFRYTILLQYWDSPEATFVRIHEASNLICGSSFCWAIHRHLLSKPLSTNFLMGGSKFLASSLRIPIIPRCWVSTSGELINPAISSNMESSTSLLMILSQKCMYYSISDLYRSSRMMIGAYYLIYSMAELMVTSWSMNLRLLRIYYRFCLRIDMLNSSRFFLKPSNSSDINQLIIIISLTNILNSLYPITAPNSKHK